MLKYFCRLKNLSFKNVSHGFLCARPVDESGSLLRLDKEPLPRYSRLNRVGVGAFVSSSFVKAGLEQSSSKQYSQAGYLGMIRGHNS